MSSRRPWTEDQLTCLRKLYLAGRGDEEIARVVDRSVHAVRHKRNEFGLLKLREHAGWTAAETSEFIRQVTIECRTSRQVAERMGKTRNAIIGKANRMGLRFASTRQTKVKVETAREPRPFSMFDDLSPSPPTWLRRNAPWRRTDRL